jgi:hypothetical protein
MLQGLDSILIALVLILVIELLRVKEQVAVEEVLVE